MDIKRICLRGSVSVAALGLLMGTASAADMRGDSYLWNSTYVGGHFGAARQSASVAPGSDNQNGDSGFLGGLQLGMNFQAAPGDLVWGIELDTGLADLTPGVGGGQHILEVNTISSLRGRLGMTRGPNLLYITAGAGLLTGRSNSSAAGAKQNFSKLRGVVGLGVEHMMSSGMSIKAEGLGFIGSNTFSKPGEPNKLKSLFMARIGINFHL